MLIFFKSIINFSSLYVISYFLVLSYLKHKVFLIQLVSLNPKKRGSVNQLVTKTKISGDTKTFLTADAVGFLKKPVQEEFKFLS